MQQLVIYRVNAASEARLHEIIRHHTQPTMRKLGFRIDGFWSSERRVGPADADDSPAGAAPREVVYLLTWDDRDTMEAAWAALNADPDYSPFIREAARDHVTHIANRLLTPL